LPKSKKITTADGYGTIPDGYVIDIDQRVWYIVEVELIRHGVYKHIVEQITKQILASSQPYTKQKIEDLAIDNYNNDQATKEKFIEAEIAEIDIRKVVGDILKEPPIIGLPIDSINNDLRDWTNTLKNKVKIWIVDKFVEVGNPENIIYGFPEEYKPEIDTADGAEASEQQVLKIKQYDVTILDLINNEKLKPSDKLFMTYKLRSGTYGKKEYEATILDDGSLSLLGQTFNSPSYAAIACIQDAGSDRNTVNGWTSWKTIDGRTLSDIREECFGG